MDPIAVKLAVFLAVAAAVGFTALAGQRYQRRWKRIKLEAENFK